VSETPRTQNAFAIANLHENKRMKPIYDEMAKLERELAKAINEISGLKEAVNLAESEWDEARSDRDAYYRELVEARRQRDALAEAANKYTIEHAVRGAVSTATIDQLEQSLAAVKGGQP
jgi:chromosome segregation ATPase